MSQVLLVKNISREGPGLLEGILRGRNISYDLVDLAAGEAFPAPAGYKAVIVFGGPDSANDTTEKMTAELGRIKEVLDQNIPYLGICLGLQTLVKAAGGEVLKAPVREIGFVDAEGVPYQVDVTEAGKAAPLFAGLTSPLHVFQLHGETVALTPDMSLLATAKTCQNQVVRVGKNAYGIQPHFELTPDMLQVWGTEDPDLIPIGLPKLNEQFAAIQTQYEQIGKTLFNNFLDVVGV